MNPGQLEALRAIPEFMDRAVTELIRYDSPVQMHGRSALSDVEFGGQVIPAGSKVILLVGSANRDPDRYPEPERLWLDRPGPPGTSFGGGVHHCLGEAFARLEAKIALGMLVTELDIAGPTGGPARWRADQVAIRGLASLLVTIRPRQH